MATTPPMTSSLLSSQDCSLQETLETYVEQPKESSGTYETSYPVICLFLQLKLSANRHLFPPPSIKFNPKDSAAMRVISVKGTIMDCS